MKFIRSNTIRVNQVLGLTLILTSLTLLAFKPWYDERKVEMVVISTSFGEMTVRLYDETPLHRDNFKKLIREAYYDSLLFHRVIQGFMIQGGDPNSRNATTNQPLGTGGPGYTVPAEFNTSFIHKKGALAAARQGDQVNPARESSGSQFYIVHGKPVTEAELKMVTDRLSDDNPFKNVGYTSEQIEIYSSLGGTPHLDGAYTVFGEVISGLNVIDSIAAVPVNRSSRPLTDQRMSIRIEKKAWP